MDATRLSDRRARALVAAKLRKRESVVWSGRPVLRYAMWAGVPGTSWLVRGPLVAAAVVVAAIFAAPGAVFTAEFLELLFDPPRVGSVFLALTLLPVSAAGTVFPFYWTLVRPRLRSYRNAQDLHYVITTERAMILLVREGVVEDEHVTELHTIADARITWLRADGAGDVVYATDGYVSDAGSSPYVVSWDVGFHGVPRAEEVLTTLGDAIARCPPRRRRRERASAVSTA